VILNVAPGTKVYLACRPVDMRKGFDGLTAVVATVQKKDPYSGHMFLFRGKQGGYLKVLYYDGSGLCLFAKRLERGKFVWPSIVDAAFNPDSGTTGASDRRDRLAADGGIGATATAPTCLIES
jgi:transposase